MYCVGIFGIPKTGVRGIRHEDEASLVAHKKKRWVDSSVVDRLQNPTRAYVYQLYLQESISEPLTLCKDETQDLWDLLQQNFPICHILVLVDAAILLDRF
jgi:hypothetical protein